MLLILAEVVLLGRSERRIDLDGDGRVREQGDVPQMPVIRLAVHVDLHMVAGVHPRKNGLTVCRLCDVQNLAQGGMEVAAGGLNMDHACVIVRMEPVQAVRRACADAPRHTDRLALDKDSEVSMDVVGHCLLTAADPVDRLVSRLCLTDAAAESQSLTSDKRSEGEDNHYSSNERPVDTVRRLWPLSTCPGSTLLTSLAAHYCNPRYDRM